MLASPNPSLNGVKSATFAFILADCSNTPSWEGGAPLSQYASVSRIQEEPLYIRLVVLQDLRMNLLLESKPRTHCSRLTVSFTPTMVSKLLGDFLPNDLDSQNHCHRVLTALQSRYPEIEVMFTSSAGDYGIDENVLTMIRNARATGVKVSLVNVMISDYGRALDPQTLIRTNQNALMNLQKQLASTIKIGACLMIGKDDNGSIMNLADMKTFLDWVAANMPAVTH